MNPNTTTTNTSNKQPSEEPVSGAKKTGGFMKLFG